MNNKFEPDRVDIRGIKAGDLITLPECDQALSDVETTIAAIHSQQDIELAGGKINPNELPKERFVWFLKTKAAIRFAKVTRKALYNQRELLWRAHEAVRKALVDIVGEEKVSKIEKDVRDET